MRSSGDRTSLPPLINVRSISKAFGSDPLFQNVSFTVSEGDRVGLIGPNGSGKSTLLRILAGTEDTDDGEIAVRKRIRLSYVEQESEFRPGDTVRSLVEAALQASAVTESERGTRFAETLGVRGLGSGSYRTLRRLAEAPRNRPGAGRGPRYSATR